MVDKGMSNATFSLRTLMEMAIGVETDFTSASLTFLRLLIK